MPFSNAKIVLKQSFVILLPYLYSFNESSLSFYEGQTS
jgi:hypothetical protein